MQSMSVHRGLKLTSYIGFSLYAWLLLFVILVVHVQKKKGFTAAVTVPKDIMLLLLLWQHIQSVEDGGS